MAHYESVPNDDTDAGFNGGFLGSLEGPDGVSLLAKGVTLGEGGKEKVARGVPLAPGTGRERTE